MPKPAARILELDALRGLAALAVVAFHYTTRYDQLFGREESLGWGAAWGSYGVDLFFMLSGFVILMTLDRTRAAFGFAWGRFTRLYPAFWTAMALTFVVVTLCGLPGQETTSRDALLNLTMIPALLGATQVDGAYWSLQAELIFYANMLLLWRVGLLRERYLAVTLSCWLLASVLGASTLSLVAHGWLPAAMEQVTKLMTLGSLEYIPLFAIGVVLYARKTERLSSAQAIKLVFASLMVSAVHHGVEASMIAGVLALLLTLAVTGWLPFLQARPLVYLGALSYPLYLVHQNIGYVVIRNAEAAGAGPWLAVLAAAGMAFSLAVLQHHRVEQPSLAWLREHKPQLGDLRVGWRSRTA